MGNLENCVVVRVSDNHRFIVVNYDRTDNNYGRPVVTNSYGCWPWVDVVKLNDVTHTNFHTSDKFGVNTRLTSSEIGSLLSKKFYFGVDDSPTFQRDYAWQPDDEQRLLKSIFEERDIGKFVFLKYDWPRTNADLVDGKQRLNTIVKFVTSQIPYNGIYWHQLSKADRRGFSGAMVQVAEIKGDNLTEADKLELFLSINTAGVPQTEEHLTSIRTRLRGLTNDN